MALLSLASVWPMGGIYATLSAQQAVHLAIACASSIKPTIRLNPVIHLP
jgi:hypothetical protein